MTAATITPSSIRCSRAPTTPGFIAERDALRAQGLLAGIGIAACLEPSGANSTFEPLLNPKNTTTTWMDSCRINVDLAAPSRQPSTPCLSGQGHETLAASVIGEVLEIDPERIRVVRPDSLAACRATAPSAAAWRSCSVGRPSMRRRS